MWTYLSEWAKIAEILVSHVNVHLRVTSAEENFNKQVDKTCSVLFPQPALPSPNGLMNNMIKVAGKKIMHRLSNMNFQAQRPIWL